MVHTCNAGTRRIEAGQLSSIQDQPGLHGKFQASMDSIARPCVEEKGRQGGRMEEGGKEWRKWEKEHLVTDRKGELADADELMIAFFFFSKIVM